LRRIGAFDYLAAKETAMKLILALAAATLIASAALPALGQGTEPLPGQKLTLTQGYGLSDHDETLIKAAVLEQTYDPASARFSEIRAMQDNYGNVKVCGMVNAKDEAGLRIGNVPFLGSLENAPATATEPPATAFTVIAVGGDACPVCLTFGNRSVPSLACWKTGRNTVPGG
jgi:hypothetical protein